MITRNMIKIIILLYLSKSFLSQETYQFPIGKNPYKDRNHISDNVVRIEISPKNNSSPYLGHLYYPETPGKYPWVEFFGGFFGALPSFTYAELISEIVKMGFIVTYTTPHGVISGDGFKNLSVWNDQNQFYKDIGPEIVKNHSNGAVKMDSTLQAQMSHSSGGEILKGLMLLDPNNVKAYYPQDSVYSTKHEDAADAPVYFSSDPVIVVQSTELCSRCCRFDANFAEREFNSYYGYKTKTFGILKDVGHCSVINYLEFQTCKAIHFCNQNEMSFLENKNYIRCVAGVAIAAFTDGMFDDRDDIRPYYTNPDNMCNKYILDGSFLCDGECDNQ